ncbi:hypothetical protein HCN44_000770 [Aphidius gifuensis]|uniref:Uncharacterized protein n=1 Tax=Aphidius gifuensis TaxID=684658 RepID=A0A835CS72_APHGI|nr:uncharacterized protein LOC122854901 [Aphidius gifuensis]XP_044011870.1 uncharacterized protein LOC122854901 [Aphidius gifuensis]KAF7990965.1 hypothetical protein HCN44_000770 [Aphidius gifuensis]
MNKSRYDGNDKFDIKTTRPKSRRGHYSGRQNYSSLGKNTHLFDDDDVGLNNDNHFGANDDGPMESEITSDILTMNGGPIPTDAGIEFNWKKRILEKQFEDMSLTGESSSSTSTSSLSSQSISSSNLSSTNDFKTNQNNIIEHTDDGDFYCLRDTTKINQSNDKYHFSFRDKKSVAKPRDILIDSVTDDMFVFQ